MHPGIPVIVVGNLTRRRQRQDAARAVDRRIPQGARAGRRRSSRAATAAAGGAPRAATVASEAAEVGDEPVVLARRSGCPVWIGAERVQVIAALRAAHPEVDVVVLDDGLQHYRLRRDLEIAVVDARGFGNGWLLPAGPLREPPSAVAHRRRRGISSGRLERATRLSRCGWKATVAHRMTDARERQPLQAFAGQRVHAVAGIGDPSRFFLHVGKAGHRRCVPHPFPDHHRFAAGRPRVRRRAAGADDREGRGKIAPRMRAPTGGSCRSPRSSTPAFGDLAAEETR